MPEGKVEIKDKVNLSIEEAAEYFGIGQTKIRELAKNPRNSFVLMVGNTTRIKRKAFERWLENKYEI